MRALAVKLSTLGRLVRTIVPRAQVVAIFDRKAQISWATDADEHEELRVLAGELLAGADGGGPSHSMRCVLDAAANYAFLMRDAGGAPAGALALTIAGPFRRAGLLLPAALETRLAPLLAAGADTTADSIERLIAVLAARINAEAVIACVPGEQFVQSFKQPASQLPDVAALRAVVSGDLAARAAHDDQPLRVDKARTAPGAPAFSFVSVPLRRQSRVVGVLAAFAPMSRRPFSVQDAALVTRSAARLVGLLR